MKLDINKKNFVNKLNKTIHTKNIINGMKDTSYVDGEKEFTIDDIYYIMKFYGIGSEREQSGFVNRVEKKMLETAFDEKTLSRLEEGYDNRILIIPKQIYFYPAILFKCKPILMSLDGLYIDENIKAIYLNNPSHLYPILRVLEKETREKNKENNIKYLLLPESICAGTNEYDIAQKVVPIPNDIKYSELKSILTDEIIKDKAKVKEYKIR